MKSCAVLALVPLMVLAADEGGAPSQSTAEFGVYPGE